MRGIRKKTEERRERTEELHSVHAWNIEHYIFINTSDTHAYELSHVVLCVSFSLVELCHWEEQAPYIYLHAMCCTRESNYIQTKLTC